MDGFGVFEWPDGRKYSQFLYLLYFRFSGQYKDNEKHGKGIFEWPDRRKFIGEWMNGLQEGEGVFIGSLGSIRKGEWKKGERVQWVKAE